MFGHLKAEDFIEILEGEEALSKHPGHQSHLRSCTRCSAALDSLQELHAEMAKSAVDEQDIPEPDWFQFRADVRNEMLSRAAQRQSKANSWSGWLLRPVITVGVAVAFVAGLSAGVFLWNRTVPAPSNANSAVASATAGSELASLNVSEATSIPDEAALDVAALEPELATWSQTNIFESISQLDDAQSEKLLRLLEAENSGSTIHQ